MKFMQYDPLTGRILFHGDVPDSMLELQGEHIVVGEGDPATQYVRDGRLMQRPGSRIRLAAHDTLIGFPASGAIVYINDVAYPCNEPTCTLAFAYPGTYRVRVECFPYLDYEVEITK